MINEDPENPSWPSFLIDLDHAVYKERQGAQEMVGTKAFMAIGALWGDQHCFMHDIESFFWVLFWIRIHYDGPGKSRSSPLVDEWNVADAKELARRKGGIIFDKEYFHDTVTSYFTPFYQPLIPWMHQLREVVLPDGKTRRTDDEGLYTVIEGICQDAQDALK